MVPCPDEPAPLTGSGFVRSRLLTLRARSQGVLNFQRPGRYWVLCGVYPDIEFLHWRVVAVTRCGATCKGERCDGEHEPTISACGQSSLMAFREFRRLARAVWPVRGQVEPVLDRTDFIRGREDRA